MVREDAGTMGRLDWWGCMVSIPPPPPPPSYDNPLTRSTPPLAVGAWVGDTVGAVGARVGD